MDANSLLGGKQRWKSKAGKNVNSGNGESQERLRSNESSSSSSSSQSGFGFRLASFSSSASSSPGSSKRKRKRGLNAIRGPMVLILFIMGITGLAAVRLFLSATGVSGWFSSLISPSSSFSVAVETDVETVVWSRPDTELLAEAKQQARQRIYKRKQADRAIEQEDFEESTPSFRKQRQPENTKKPVVESSSATEPFSSTKPSNDIVPKALKEQENIQDEYDSKDGEEEKSSAGDGGSAKQAASEGPSSPFIPAAQLSPKIAKSFAYFKGNCMSFCRAIVRAGYRMMPGLTAPAYPEFLLIPYKLVNKYASLKTSIVNQVGYGSSCIGGGKGKQLLCKEDFAKENGCSYSNLGIQPPQWNLKYPQECKKFFNHASQPEQADQIWIVKPGGAFHGAGIKLYDGVSKLQNKYRCAETLGDGVIAQKYVSQPALFGGHKFDFRSYLLISSMNPYIVFYHDGFVRRSEHAYSTSSSDLNNPLAHITNSRGQSSENHFFSFEQLQETLTRESGFAPDFVDKVARPHMKRVTNFIFQAARKKFKHRPVRFQLFALDWMLDSSGSLGLLEANGNPQTTNYPGLTFAPAIWTTMMDLVHLVQVEPDKLPADFSVKAGYKFAGWEMVLNELEEAHHGETYNPCNFHQYVKDRHPFYSFALNK